MDVGRVLVMIGVLFILAGFLFTFREHFPWLKHLGRLPGDIAVERENFRFYFPITTSIILSLVLTFLAYFFRR